MTTLLTYQLRNVETRWPSIECHHDARFMDAINIKNIEPETIDLVITSPPYWSIKDYGNIGQLGYQDSLDKYMMKLTNIFKACITALKPNGKLCINIGDQFLKASTPPRKVYQIIPLHAMLINQLVNYAGDQLVYLGSINWNKVTRSKTSGGGQIMGSYPFPKSGYFFVNREYIIIMRKLGKEKSHHKPSEFNKTASRISLEDWRLFFKDTWKIPPADQKSHIAMFPEELPARLIKMYSFVGDTVLDPFLGSGTTMLAASKLARNSIGYEIGFETPDGLPWKDLIKSKVTIPQHELEYVYEDETSMPELRHLIVYNKYQFF